MSLWPPPSQVNPAMAPYIFMERNGIHIIDLHKTVAKVDEAAEALKGIARVVRRSCSSLLKNRLRKL